jgi:hypothetical protein
MPSNHRHLGGQVAAWPPGVSLAAGTTETPGVLRRFHPLPRSCGRVHVLGREWPPLLSPSRAPLRGTGGHFSPYGCQPISGASSSRGALLSTEREKRGHGCSTAHTYAQSLFDLVSALPGAEADGDQVGEHGPQRVPSGRVRSRCGARRVCARDLTRPRSLCPAAHRR